MSAQLSPTPVQKFFDNNGFPAAFGTLSTFAAGTTTPQATYVDSSQTTPNTNPIVLNFRGEANVWLDPSKSYKFVLKDFLGILIWTVDNITIGNANPSYNIIPSVDNLYTLGNTSFAWANVYIGSNHAPVLDTVSGNIGYYARTAAEISASVVPVNFSYPPGVIDRYGTNTTPGTTNMNAAFAASLAQQQNGGAPMQLLPANYLVTTNAIKTQSNVKPVVIFGVPFRSCIINTAPVSTPTIQLIDQFSFEISGIVFAGRATFPNIAIDLTSANGGSRTGFGKVIDCVLAPNGVGIHIAGANDILIDTCKYWPNGMGGMPGGATNDGANALPAGILADYNGIGGFNTGEVNHILVRDFQLGSVNSTAATPPGSGILVDGSLNGSSTAPNANHASSEWHIDGYDSGGADRALYLRFCQFFTVESLYTSKILIDNACTGLTFQSIFGGSFTIDSTKPLGGCERLTYISCVGSITADAGNGLANHINCFWTGGDADASVPKRILGGRVAGGNRTTDAIGGNGLCLGPAGAIQLAGTSGAGLTIQTAGQTVVRINPSSTCTAGILAKPTSPTATPDGCTVRVINLSGATFTMAAAGTSNVADGVLCVIAAQRSMDFTFDTSASGLWFHS